MAVICYTHSDIVKVENKYKSFYLTPLVMKTAKSVMLIVTRIFQRYP